MNDQSNMVQVLCSVSEYTIEHTYWQILADKSDKEAVTCIAELIAELAEDSALDLTAFKTLLYHEIKRALGETFSYLVEKEEKDKNDDNAQ